MGLKQKDILARFALTTGEYEDVEKSLIKYLEQRNLDSRDRHRAALALAGARSILKELAKVDENIRASWDLEGQGTPRPARRPVEGDVGTWSHCGDRTPHRPHVHTVTMNEGPHHGVQCNGYTN